jgi:hypothetical protein
MVTLFFVSEGQASGIECSHRTIWNSVRSRWPLQRSVVEVCAITRCTGDHVFAYSDGYPVAGLARRDARALTNQAVLFCYAVGVRTAH